MNVWEWGQKKDKERLLLCLCLCLDRFLRSALSIHFPEVHVKVCLVVLGVFLKENKKAARFHQAELGIQKHSMNTGKGWIRFLKFYHYPTLFWDVVVNSVVERRATTATRTGRPDRVALSVRYVCVCGMVQACLFIWWNNKIELSWELTAPSLNWDLDSVFCTETLSIHHTAS